MVGSRREMVESRSGRRASLPAGLRSLRAARRYGGRTAGRGGSGPAVLAISVLLVGGAGALVVARHIVLAGAVALAASVVLLAGWRLAERDPDPRTQLIGMLTDPVFDVCLLLAVAWAGRNGSVRIPMLALVAAGSAYLASYMRARADALGYRTLEAWGYRALRAVILSVGLLTQRVEAALWAFVVVTALAVVVRAANVALQERHG